MVQLLIKAREDGDLSQRQLSALLKRPINFVFKVEAGERELNAVELLIYVEALGLDFVEFSKTLRDAIRKLEGQV